MGGGQMQGCAIAGDDPETMPVRSGVEILQDSLVEFDESLPAQLLARHPEGIVIGVAPGRKREAGEELIQFDLERSHQVDQQDTDDPFKGKDGAPGEVAGSLAMTGNKVHRSDKCVDLIDRIGILEGRV